MKFFQFFDTNRFSTGPLQNCCALNSRRYSFWKFYSPLSRYQWCGESLTMHIADTSSHRLFLSMIWRVGDSQHWWYGESPSIFISRILSASLYRVSVTVGDLEMIYFILKGSPRLYRDIWEKINRGCILPSPRVIERFGKGVLRQSWRLPASWIARSQFLILNVSSNLNPKSKGYSNCVRDLCQTDKKIYLIDMFL